MLRDCSQVGGLSARRAAAAPIRQRSGSFSASLRSAPVSARVSPGVIRMPCCLSSMDQDDIGRVCGAQHLTAMQDGQSRRQ